MSVGGVWSNSYGSVMDLTQMVGGMVTGTYQSSTGSTGKYYVAGMSGLTEPTPALGQSVALSIYWRSYTGGQGDPSWHWVSGLSGQLDIGGPVPTLYLMHAMVATDDFPGLADVGTYIDKLIYTPKKDAPAEAAVELAVEGKAVAADPIGGLWVSREDPSLRLNVTVNNPQAGYVVGTLFTATRQFVVLGFTDVDAQPAGIARQGLSVSVGINTTGACQSMAGSLDFSTGILTLTLFTSRGTAPDAIYTQTKTSQLTFIRS